MSQENDLLETLAGLEPPAFRRLLARLALLQAYARYRSSFGLSDLRAQEDVAERYASREVDVDDWVYEAYGSVTGRTLRRWEERIRQSGLVGLTDAYGKRSERDYNSYFGPASEMRKVALYFLADHPDCTSTDVLRELQDRFGENEAPDLRTVQRFLQKFRA